MEGHRRIPERHLPGREALGKPPDETVSPSSGDVSGTVAGAGISLDLGSETWNGNIGGSAVTLNVPQPDGTIQGVTCDVASLDEWNQAVNSLDDQASTDDGQAQQAQASASAQASVSIAQQALAHDVSSLQTDAASLDGDGSLASDIKSMQSGYGTEQQDYRSEQADSCDSMGGDADTVGGDADTVGGDLDSLQGDISYLQGSGVAAVKNDRSAVQGDLSTLANQGASPAIGSSGAVAAGNKALKDAADAIAWATQQGNAINKQAQQLASAAQSYASAHCG